RRPVEDQFSGLTCRTLRFNRVDETTVDDDRKQLAFALFLIVPGKRYLSTRYARKRLPVDFFNCAADAFELRALPRLRQCSIVGVGIHLVPALCANGLRQIERN